MATIPIFTRHPPLKVRATEVERGSIRSLISTNGKIEPIQNFEAHAPIATTVKRLFVKEGDHVRKGQLLLQLDDDDLRSQAARAQALMKSAQADESDLTTGGTREELLTLDAQLSKARAARDAAQRNLDAFRRLQQQGAASAGEAQQAQEALQRAQADATLLEQKQKDRYSQPEVARVQAQGTQAQAAYEAAEDALRKSSVRAPFDGIVYTLPVKQGAYVQTGDLLLQVGDLSKMLVHRRARRQGLGAALLRAAESVARDCGKSLLVLDTASADAERLYASLGWRRVGVIPGHALLPQGGLCDTTVFYRIM